VKIEKGKHNFNIQQPTNDSLERADTNAFITAMRRWHTQHGDLQRSTHLFL